MAFEIFRAQTQPPMNSVERELSGDVSAPRNDVDATFAQQPARTPLQKIIAAQMRTNAEAQGRAQAKAVANQQLDAASKMKVTLNPGGTVDIKYLDPNLLDPNGTKAKEAYEGPKQAVEKALAPQEPAAPASPAAAAPVFDAATAEPMFQAADAAYGRRVPRPHEVRQMLQTPEGTRQIVALLGGTEAHARQYIRTMNKPGNLDKRAAIATEKLLGKYGEIYDAMNKVAEDSLSRQRHEVEKQNTVRLSKQQERAEREAVEKDIEGIDFTAFDKSEWAQVVADRTGLSPEQVNEFGGVIKIVARQQLKKEKDSALKEWTGGGAAQERLATYESVGDALRVFGLPLSDTERESFTAAWRAARKERADKDKKQQQADERLANASREKPAKPRKLNGFDASNASVDGLLAAKGDPAFDQTSVEQAINNRRGRLEKELTEISAQLAANDLAFQQLDKQRKPLKPGAKANQQVEQKIIEKQALGRKLVEQSRAKQAELAKLGGPAAAKPDPLGIR